MSTTVLPALVGYGIEVTRTPMWSSQIQKSISGKETRLAFYSYPEYQWDVTYNVLRSSAAYSYELQQMLNLFNSMQGQVNTFLYTDADDNSTTNQQIGVGNGATANYQLVRSLPVSNAFIEPVLAPNVITSINLSGASIPAAGLSAPNVPTLGHTAGGSLVTTTYYVKITFVTNSGETLPSTEVSLAVTGSNLLTVTQSGSAPIGAVSWNIYVSNTAGGGSGAEHLQATLAIGTTSWTEPATGLISGIAPPQANTTGWTVYPWGTTSPGPGVLTFNGIVANSVLITATFSYYWPVRFISDKLGFDRFLSQKYRIKKFSFKSVKN